MSSGWYTNPKMICLLARLEGEYFRDRALLASDKNRTNAIMIKEYVGSGAVPHSTRGGREPAAAVATTSSSRSPDVMLPLSQSAAASFTSPLSPHGHLSRIPASLSCPDVQVVPAMNRAYGGIPSSNGYPARLETYNSPPPVRNRVLTYSPSLNYCPPSAMPVGWVGGGSPQHGGSQSTASQSAGPRVPTSHRFPTSLPHQNATGTASWDPPKGPSSCEKQQRPGYTTQQRRKVVVTSIQQKAKLSDIQNWIRQQIGEHAAAIIGISIPLKENNSQIRGHAYITMANTAAAEATVRMLNQKLFQGRVVSSRLTKEGVTDAHRYKPSREATAPRRHRREQSKEQPGLRPRQTTLDRPLQRDDVRQLRYSHLNSNPLPESLGRRSRDENPKQEASKLSPPVIAHGSSTRMTK
ncbi:hypothetical protein QQS21_006598 [Conoideocrella luteorostrata]|uniref:RRM domain-containing protein n=1 Tax=Conoideocrella luteorostrata TaxID=1105319 RepID=A0AAJ0CN53_9HYPO|nr:hypothetical protein QQS21_006598 [Conoideocrella luteorostrata]